MKTTRVLSVASATAVLLLGSRGVAGATCSPQCGLGYNCINGQCTTSGSYYNPGAAYVAPPDLGSNVKVYTPSTSVSTINGDLSAAYNNTGKFSASQFITNRYAFIFAPGSYSASVNVPIGYYTEIAGAGDMPDAVSLAGPVHSDGDPSTNPTHGGLDNFWRAVENFESASSGNLEWVTSQGCAFRRMHVTKGVDLSQSGGYTSGGFVADSKVDGTVTSGSQQQWFTRNSKIGWSGGNWNMVFEGVSFTSSNPPADSSFPGSPYTVVSTTTVVREKPFLYIDRDGVWNVFVPAVRTGSSSYSWSAPGTEAGTKIPLASFYIAKAGVDTASTMNAALSQGKHLLVTPGIYTLSAPLHVTAANTVVLGLGLATLTPENGVNALDIDDLDGVHVAGLMFDAGATSSSVLMQVGPTGSSASHSGDPSTLHDVFFRVGGAQAGKAGTCLQVNSHNVIGDNVWAWRADHGTGVGWTSNVAPDGVVVNGSSVTMHGLFVEHFQSYQTTWNGGSGATFFYQSELPYDPPSQSAWMHGSTNGYASYKVNGASHVAKGLGIYAVFSNAGVNEDNAIETAAGARFHHMVTLSITSNGHIYEVINGTGGAANPADFTHYPRLGDYDN
jgi:hypothetical protein